MSSRIRRLVPGAALAVAVLLVATACAGVPPATESPTPTVTDRRPLAELDLFADPRSAAGPALAVLASEAVDPVAADPAQRLPTTVVSRDASGDRAVTVDDTSRVVALDIAGSIAATVWGLGFGGTLVGRDVSTTFPGSEDLPLITSNGHTVDAEAVLALHPTLVITDGSIGPRDVLEQLREAGVAVVFVSSEPSFAGAADLARQVADVFGAAEAGELLADRITSEVDGKIAEIAGIIPADPADRVRMMFLYLRGGSGVYYLFGAESGADVLIAGLGGVDVAAEIGWVGMRPMTDEAIVAADPDLILVMTDGIASAGGVTGLLAEKPALALTRAGRNERFVAMADGVVLGFGPRSPAVLDALARAIYAIPGS